jgi:hypothetical protein
LDIGCCRKLKAVNIGTLCNNHAKTPLSDV